MADEYLGSIHGLFFVGWWIQPLLVLLFGRVRTFPLNGGASLPIASILKAEDEEAKGMLSGATLFMNANL